MHYVRSLTSLFILSSLVAISFTVRKHPRVLVFSKTTGFHHSSIPNGVAAVQKLGEENGFDVDTTTDASKFNDKNLKKYAAVIFMNTTDNKDILFDQEEKEAFKHFIEKGGGFVGVHSATDTEYQWDWYGGLVGAYFNGHPRPQEAVLHIVDPSHISTQHLPAEWKRTDEWYNFKNLAKDLHVLITIDEKSYQGGTNGDFHPMAWYHDYDGGRAFYTELGHTEASYTDPLYLKHLLGGILYAMGRK